MPTLSPDAQTLLAALPDGALWCYDDRIVAGNAIVAELLGVSTESLPGRRIWEFVHPDDLERLKARYRDRRSGRPVPDAYEIDIVRAGGERARVEIVPRALEGPDLLILLRDRRVQAFESQLVAGLSYAAERVQRARTVQEALEIAGFGLKEQGIALHVSRVVDDHLEVTYGPARDPMIELLERVVGPVTRARIPLASLVVATPVIRDQHEVYVDDLAGTVMRFARRVAPGVPIADDFLSGKGYGQGMFAPLVVEGRSWGIALFASDRLTRSQAAALHLFSAQMSSALEVIEAIVRLERTNRQVEGIQAVLEAGTDPTSGQMVPAMLDIACAATSSEVAVLYLQEGDRLVRSAARAGSERFAADMLAEVPRAGPSFERAAALHGAEWKGWRPEATAEELARELEVLPLRIQGRAAGLLILGRGADAPYRAAELRDAGLLADQIGVQMEKARLLQDARDRVDELDLLLDVGRVITESVESERIFDVAMTSLKRMLSCDQAFVWLHDDAVGVLRGAACSDPEHRESFLAARLKLSDPSGAVRAMLTGQPVRVTYAAASPQLHQPLRTQYRLRSVLVLPLLHHDAAIGAISVADTQKERAWTDSEVERGTVIARQLAVALANARLFVDLRRSYDDLARTQAELVKRERLAALGELAAVVAHEVRNPLGVIFNSISSLRRQGVSAADSEMLLGIVGEEADRLNRIVGDLLDFSRPHDPDLRLVPLPPLLLSVRDAVLPHNAGGVAIAVEVEEGLPHVRLDARMMRQALLNLALNAIQAMPRGGSLTFRAARAAHRPGVRIDIRDTGPGIAAGSVQRIFEPFYTTKATGTGLGLAVVKRIVEGHGGEITVESRDGQGTTFSIWIPETAASP